MSIIKEFKSLRIKEGEDFNFSVYPHGYAIKILLRDRQKCFFMFDSKLSPLDFLLSKGVKVRGH